MSPPKKKGGLIDKSILKGKKAKAFILGKQIVGPRCFMQLICFGPFGHLIPNHFLMKATPLYQESL